MLPRTARIIGYSETIDIPHDFELGEVVEFLGFVDDFEYYYTFTNGELVQDLVKSEFEWIE